MSHPAVLVSPAELDAMMKTDQVVVIDTRDADAYAAGHIPGAVNLDLNSPDFDKKIATLDTNKTYLVHCAASHFHSRISGMSWPWRAMKCLCSTSLSRTICFR